MPQPPFQFRAGGSSVPFTQPQQNNTHSLQMQSDTQTQASQPPSAHLQLSTMDMSVLEGITPEQLATIARLFQSGALQMPPSPSAVPPKPNDLNSTSLPGSSEKLNLPTQEEADVDMEIEEGEVDEDHEDGTFAPTRGFLPSPHTRANGRDSHLHSSVRGTNSQMPTTSPKLNANEQRPLSAQRSIAMPTVPTINGSTHKSKDESARLFIREMVNAGYSFDDISREVRGTAALSRMFQELGLPIQAKPSAQLNAMTTAAVAQPKPVMNQPVMYESAQQPLQNKRAAAVKPNPPDRSEYLARLQAAKNKKADNVLEKAVPVKSISIEKAPSPPQKPANEPTPEPARSTGAKLVSASKVISMTELARRRLEALKAQQAAAAEAKRNAVSSPGPRSAAAPATPNVQANSSPVQQGLGAGIADLGSRIGQTEGRVQPAPSPSMLSHTVATPTSTFSRLPGLFMANDPGATQPSAKPLEIAPQVQFAGYSSPRPNIQFGQAPSISNPLPSLAKYSSPFGSQTIPRKRAVASDFDSEPIQPSSVKRPFGQSRGNSEDESLVIQISDDEDDESELEQISEQPTLPGLQTKSFRDVGPLRDFPAKANLNVPSPSPAVGTPNSDAYAEKMKEIEEFKRRIAEKEQRKKANGKTPVLAVAALSGISTPDIEPASKPASGLGDEQSVQAEENEASSGESIYKDDAEMMHVELDQSVVESNADQAPGPSESGEVSEVDGVNGGQSMGSAEASSDSDMDLDADSNPSPPVESAPESVYVNDDGADEPGPALQVQPDNEELVPMIIQNLSEPMRYFTPYRSPLEGLRASAAMTPSGVTPDPQGQGSPQDNDSDLFSMD